MNDKPKVFCIGMPRTGTTSLGHALTKLGYTVAGPFMMADDEWDHDLIYEKAEDKLTRCNAVRDTPWAVLYDWLDESYPDARFILTVRDCREWMSSMKRHFVYRRLPAFT